MALSIYWIYRATCKATNKCYVGLDTRGKRRNEHLGNARRGCEYTFHRALRKYPDPDYWEWDLIGISTNKSDLFEMEKKAISKNDSFSNGYNLTQGGEGRLGYQHSDKTKAKMRASQIENPRGACLSGSFRSDETKKKISKAMKGKTNRKGIINTPEHNEKISKANKGRVFSDEHKRRISESKKEKPVSEEHKRRISAKLKGRPRTEETKQKISEALRRRRIEQSLQK